MGTLHARHEGRKCGAYGVEKCDAKNPSEQVLNSDRVTLIIGTSAFFLRRYLKRSWRKKRRRR